MSAGFFFLRSSRGAEVEADDDDEVPAAAAAPAGLRLAPAPLAKDAKGLRPAGPPREVMVGPRESGRKEMESADIVRRGTTTDRVNEEREKMIGAEQQARAQKTFLCFLSCEERERERERDRAKPRESSEQILLSQTLSLAGEKPNQKHERALLTAASSSNSNGNAQGHPAGEKGARREMHRRRDRRQCRDAELRPRRAPLAVRQRFFCL